MGYPNEFPKSTGVVAGVVTGGHIKKLPPDENSTCQVTFPGLHGKNVDPDQTPFITGAHPPRAQDGEQTNFPLEPGTPIYSLPYSGEPSSRIVALAPNGKNIGGGSPGNLDLNGLWAYAAEAEKIGKIVSKGYQTTQEDGAVVRKPKDGEEWAHLLTKGLPTHAAMYPLAGTVLEAIQQIDTAIEQFSGILDSSALSQMAGAPMSMSSVGSSMSNTQKRRATANMTPEVVTGFDSMLNLMQNGDGTIYDFPIDGRVHEEIFIDNAVDLFSQATTLGDVIHCFRELQCNTALHGHDALDDVEITVSTAFGDVIHTVNHSGEITNANTSNVLSNTVNATTQSAVASYHSLGSALSSGAKNGGTDSGNNLWKEQAQKIAELIGRVPTEATAAAKKTLEELTSQWNPRAVSTIKTPVYNGRHTPFTLSLP